MGMGALPHVVNDRKNMKYTIKTLMNIPEENIIEVEEATLDKLEEVQKKLRVHA